MRSRRIDSPNPHEGKSTAEILAFLHRMEPEWSAVRQAAKDSEEKYHSLRKVAFEARRKLLTADASNVGALLLAWQLAEADVAANESSELEDRADQVEVQLCRARSAYYESAEREAREKIPASLRDLDDLPPRLFPLHERVSDRETARERGRRRQDESDDGVLGLVLDVARGRERGTEESSEQTCTDGDDADGHDGGSFGVVGVRSDAWIAVRIRRRTTLSLSCRATCVLEGSRNGLVVGMTTSDHLADVVGDRLSRGAAAKWVRVHRGSYRRMSVIDAGSLRFAPGYRYAVAVHGSTRTTIKSSPAMRWISRSAPS